jgi:Na+/melibiose symporter-like transporter
LLAQRLLALHSVRAVLIPVPLAQHLLVLHLLQVLHHLLQLDHPRITK